MPLFGRRQEPGMSPGVAIDDKGDITLNVKTVEQARLGIQELKLKKKEYALAKKQVTTQMTAIRAEYSNETAKKGSLVRGSGGVSKFIREVQHADRDGARRQKAKQLEPLEQQKQTLDRILINIDKAVTMLEQYITQKTSK